jgi:hypothetical protein
MAQLITKSLWDRVICAGWLGLALLAGVAAGVRVAIILHGL